MKNLDNQKYVMELLIQGGVDIKPSIPGMFIIIIHYLFRFV